MKKFYAILAVAMLLVTPYAQAKTCSGASCNYIDAAGNSGFQSGWTNWTTSGGQLVTGSCYSSTMAEIQNTEWVQRDTFLVDGTFTNGFKIVFRAGLPVDTNNFYQQLKVRVTNTDTGVYEEFSLHGSSYDHHCGYNTFWLSNNYSNANVSVKFTSGNFSTQVWQIDDVGFWAYY